MRGWAAGVFGLFLTLFFSPANGAPLEAYGRLPTLDDVVISPDGKRIAYAKGVDTERFVAIQTLGEREPFAVIRTNNQKIRQLNWADDEHLLITASQTGTIPDTIGHTAEWYLTLCFDIPKREQWQIFQGTKDVNIINGTFGIPRARTVNGRTLIYAEAIYFSGEDGWGGLFAIDLGAGHRATLVEGDKANTESWLLDGQGKAVAAWGYRESSRHWSLRLKRNGQWSDVFGIDAPIDTPTVEGLSPDGSAVVMKLRKDEGYETDTVSLADGSLHAAPTDLQEVDEFFEDPMSGRVLGGIRMGMKADYAFFNAQDASSWKSILSAFGDAEVRFVSASADHRKVVVRVFGPRDGDNFELIDLDTGLTTFLGRAYDGIDAADISPVTTTSYKAGDGFEIPAYLTLPRDREPKNLPLVVLPHGGPYARDMPGFDWWAQALASRGYAVLQPQYRGSYGFGWSHFAAAFGQWGRKMQTDLSDGVRYLAGKGIVDPKRVCIVGASYGGYAALAGAALDRGVYRCAVSVAGVSDLRALLSWRMGNRPDEIGTRFDTRLMGASNRDDPLLDQISPVKRVGEVDIPILLIHGRDDTRVPIAQSEEMADALKAAGKPVTFVELASEDHFLSRSETRLQMLKATVDFLEANNPP